MDIEQALSQAELYIRQNQASQARAILGEILGDNSQNEEAWILSAQVSDKPEQVIYCLKQAIKINPGSSRARLLLERLQKPPFPGAAVVPSQPAPASKPDPQPRREPPLGIAMPEETQPASSSRPSVKPAGIEASFPDNTAAPETSYPARSDYMFPEFDNYATDTAGMVQEAATGAERLGEVKKRPMRWLERIFTIAASACLLAPWIFDGTTSKTANGLQVMLGSIFSPLGLDVGIAGLAFLASLVLPLLMLFRFKSGATQKWGERATIALAPMAAILSLELISFYYAGMTSKVELRWGIWASLAFYSLAGISALINARRLGNVDRKAISTAWAGRIFTWLFSMGDILAILVTLAGLVMLGKFNLFGIAIPFIWLLLGALLSLIA